MGNQAEIARAFFDGNQSLFPPSCIARIDLYCAELG
jgi:hypothetical protein